jgi:predicted ATPase
MITQITVQNVRIFDKQKWEFNLPPLTVFCGTNSSGKSTILKSLLLIRQTAGIYESYIPSKGCLRFIGSQVDLGNYKSFVSHKDCSKSISVGFELKDSISIKSLNEINGYKTEKSKKAESSKKTIDENLKTDYFLKSLFTFSIDNSESIPNPENKKHNEEAQLPGVLDSAEFDVRNANGESIVNWIVYRRQNSEGSNYIIRMPKTFFQGLYGDLVSDLFKNSNELVDQLVAGDSIEFPTTLHGLLPTNISITQNSNNEKNPKTRNFELPLHPFFDVIHRDFRYALASIDYLGPLRTPAKRYYMTPLESRPQMDPEGEYIPYIFKDLSMGKEELVNYMPPNGSELKNKVALQDAVNDWLHYIRTGELLVEPERINEISYEQTKVLLEFKIKGIYLNEQHSLADSGFGYSQILPILIRGLMANSGGTLVIEQPELHLNPALQTRLAEFFISLIKARKQVIIETHSEHIINMIRVLTAEDQSAMISDMSKIYYIDNLNNVPIVHELSISDNGMVPKWPQSFFGEAASLSGRLLRAQKNKRKNIEG